ncbi:MAG: hypothetical protein PHH09_08450 [Methanoregulaceae archaeon]|nr:hypothetical protein [Methanoregulaceae archaeon]
MTCIYHVERNDLGFGTAEQCELSGEMNPDCDNCDECTEEAAA